MGVRLSPLAILPGKIPSKSPDLLGLITLIINFLINGVEFSKELHQIIFTLDEVFRN